MSSYLGKNIGTHWINQKRICYSQTPNSFNAIVSGATLEMYILNKKRNQSSTQNST